MRIINALLATWKTKTTEEKIKTVLHGIAVIGGGVIGNAIGDKCNEAVSDGTGPMRQVNKFCTKITGIALGSVVAETAAKSMDETVDQFAGLIRGRKEEHVDA